MLYGKQTVTETVSGVLITNSTVACYFASLYYRYILPLVRIIKIPITIISIPITYVISNLNAIYNAACVVLGYIYFIASSLSRNIVTKPLRFFMDLIKVFIELSLDFFMLPANIVLKVVFGTSTNQVVKNIGTLDRKDYEIIADLLRTFILHWLALVLIGTIIGVINSTVSFKLLNKIFDFWFLKWDVKFNFFATLLDWLTFVPKILFNSVSSLFSAEKEPQKQHEKHEKHPNHTQQEKKKSFSGTKFSINDYKLLLGTNSSPLTNADGLTNTINRSPSRQQQQNKIHEQKHLSNSPGGYPKKRPFSTPSISKATITEQISSRNERMRRHSSAREELATTLPENFFQQLSTPVNSDIEQDDTEENDYENLKSLVSSTGGLAHESNTQLSEPSPRSQHEDESVSEVSESVFSSEYNADTETLKQNDQHDIGTVTTTGSSGVRNAQTDKVTSPFSRFEKS